MKAAYYSFFLLIFSILGAVSHADDSDSKSSVDYVKSIDALIHSKAEDPNLLSTKLAIDKLIDPNLDVQKTKSEIYKMVSDIEGMFKQGATESDKVVALRFYIYEAGKWNDDNPFSYDLDDPQGVSRKSRLIHNYLETRKGNCVSMPVLHAILGQEVGLDMTLSTAPLHVFVKYTDENGKTINIEATSGGHPARAEWYEQNLPMLPKAIKNGMYMDSLSQEQTVAVLGHDLASHLLRTEDYENAILVSEKLIPLFPNYAPLYMSRGSGYYKLIERDFQKKYPNANDIPKELQPQFMSFTQQNSISFKMAEDLGWADPDELLKTRKAKK